MSLSGLHDPTSAVPSSSAPFAPSPEPTIQSEAARLTLLKDSITTRLDVYYSVLTTNKVTMSTPLVDPEGFPRADIDVAGVRTARSQIHRLKNDLKDCIKEMSSLLERGLPRAPEGEKQEGQGEELDTPMRNGEREPFARVDGVFPGGPADVAGVKREDLFVSLGEVNVTNHDEFKEVAALVNRSEGTALPLVILRPSPSTSSAGETPPPPMRLHLRLVPKTGWGGRGMLGCHIVPV